MAFGVERTAGSEIGADGENGCITAKGNTVILL
jgi:hypothetical protein